MKKIIFISVLLLKSIFIFSQTSDSPNVSMTLRGANAVVFKCSEMPAGEIYRKALEFAITRGGKLVDARPNSSIIFSGYDEKFFSYGIGMLSYASIGYKITLSIKNSRYKFEFSPMPSVDVNHKWFFKNNGELKSKYEKSLKSYNTSINNIAELIYQYIVGKNESKDEF